MKANYQKCLKVVLAYEGGYVNHPKDPGGPTNKGVTQAVYDAWRTSQGQKIRTVRVITDQEVASIYRQQYWDIIKGDRLPAGVDLAVFDFAVNSGVKRAVQSVQKVMSQQFAIPDMSQDGIMGEVTLAGADKSADSDEVKFIELYCAERMRFVQSLRTFSTFGVGWTRRIEGRKVGAQDEDTGVVDLAVKLALGDKTFGVPKISQETAELPKGKADAGDTKIEATPEGAAGGTGLLGGAGVVATKAGVGGWIGDHIISLGQFAGMTKEQIEPLVSYSTYIGWAFVALTVLGALGIVATRLKKQQEGRA